MTDRKGRALKEALSHSLHHTAVTHRKERQFSMRVDAEIDELAKARAASLGLTRAAYILALMRFDLQDFVPPAAPGTTAPAKATDLFQ